MLDLFSVGGSRQAVLDEPSGKHFHVPLWHFATCLCVKLIPWQQESDFSCTESISKKCTPRNCQQQFACQVRMSPLTGLAWISLNPFSGHWSKRHRGSSCQGFSCESHSAWLFTGGLRHIPPPHLMLGLLGVLYSKLNWTIFKDSQTVTSPDKSFENPSWNKIHWDAWPHPNLGLFAHHFQDLRLAAQLLT